MWVIESFAGRTQMVHRLVRHKPGRARPAEGLSLHAPGHPALEGSGLFRNTPRIRRGHLPRWPGMRGKGQRHSEIPWRGVPYRPLLAFRGIIGGPGLFQTFQPWVGRITRMVRDGGPLWGGPSVPIVRGFGSSGDQAPSTGPMALRATGKNCQGRMKDRQTTFRDPRIAFPWPDGC